MKTPIIFCHYGDTPYLRYTLSCARLNNPDKDVVLLGDVHNRRVAGACGVKHYPFEDFNYGSDLETFGRVYRLIHGRRFRPVIGNRDWVNFVFQRWFFVRNFVKSFVIGDFWHFDSDNMLLDSLSQHEHKYRGYECTEQCDGICMNGYISGPEIVDRYIRKINELFQREEYLDEQKREFDRVNPRYAFTEMRAYDIFRKEEQVRSLRLNSVIDGSAFDDCVCLEQGMESENLANGRQVKKVLLHADGRFFCRERQSLRLVQMNSLNLSWVPLYVFGLVWAHALKRRAGSEIAPDISRMTTLSSQRIPLEFTLKSAFGGVKRAVKLAIGCGGR